MLEIACQPARASRARAERILQRINAGVTFHEAQGYEYHRDVTQALADSQRKIISEADRLILAYAKMYSAS